MHIHIDSADRTSGTIDNFTIDLQSIGGALSRGTNGMIGVKTIQVPYTWYNIRNKVNNSFRVVFSDLGTKIIYLASTTGGEGSPTMTQINANIISQMNVNTAGNTFTGLVNTVDGSYTLTETSGFFWSIVFDQDPFTNKVLGFADSITYAATAGRIKGANFINTTPERYLYIKTNFPIKDGYDFDSFTDNISGILTKVPVTGPSIVIGSNITYEPFNLNMRECGNFNNLVTFKLVHDNNTPVDLHGLDWCMTLVYEKK